MKPTGQRQASGGARAFLAGAGLRAAARVSPSLAARAAGALFRLPPRHKTTAVERRLLASGRRRFLAAGAGRVAVWSWGEGPPILLVHGWGSRGVRLHSFIEPIVAAGRSAVTFDAPGHGESDGRLSSLPQFVEALGVAAGEIGPVRTVIAHSMGGAAAALAIRNGLAVERAVFLAPAANPGAYTRRFAQALGISSQVRELMERRFERRFGYRWEEFDVPSQVRSFTTALLLFHDSEDREVAWTDGEAIARAWPGARLVTTRGLGHKRIVHDPEVVARAVAFLTVGSSRSDEPTAARADVDRSRSL